MLYACKMDFFALLCSGTAPHVPRAATYDDFVRVSGEIMKGRTTKQQHEVVRNTLYALMPKPLILFLR